MAVQRIAAANWKMHGLRSDMVELSVIAGAAVERPGVKTLVFPPVTMLEQTSGLAGVQAGAQDCHDKTSGAYTGDLSAQMLAECGAQAVIVGHSERRMYHGETSGTVAAKARAAWNAGLRAVICIGETGDQYLAGQTLDVLNDQLALSVPDGATPESTAVAYEPVWAIGTGMTPTVAEIESVHANIRTHLTHRFGDTGKTIPILYGGSVNAGNAHEIFATPNVDGGLVGGASLKAETFVPIINALAECGERT